MAQRIGRGLVLALSGLPAIPPEHHWVGKPPGAVGQPIDVSVTSPPTIVALMRVTL